MLHPTDATLNEYLDAALTPAQAASLARHLAACPACAARAAALRGVFTALEALPAVPLSVDLAARVVAQLPASPPADFRLPTPPGLRWFALLQVAGLLAVLVFSWPFLEEILLNFGPALPPVAWETWLTPLFASWAALWAAPWWNNLPKLSLPFDPFLAALAGGSVAALWLVGNGLLLRPSSRK